MLSSNLRGWVRAVPLRIGAGAPFATPSRPIYAWSSASRAAQVLHIAFTCPVSSTLRNCSGVLT